MIKEATGLKSVYLIAKENWLKRKNDYSWLAKEAEFWFSQKINIPTEGAGWLHNYNCSKTGIKLKFDINKPHKHFCPVCKCYHSGKELDKAWIYCYQRRLINGVKCLATIGVMEDNFTYLDKAKDIILSLTKQYLNYPVHGKWAGKGRLQGQSVEEARWLIDFMECIDILSLSKILNPSELQRINERVIRPAANLIQKFNFDIHNIQCWHASAIFIAGIHLNDKYFIKLGKESLEKNIKKGILEDGIWWECSMVYHFYTLEAFIKSLLSAKLNRIKISYKDKVKPMFISPFSLVLPDGELPAINDGWIMKNIKDYSHIYEMGLKLFPEEGNLRKILSYIYSLPGTKRNSLESLWFGEKEIPIYRGEFDKESFSIFPYSGLVSWKKENNYLLLKCGPHGGGHGHFDKLSILLFLNGYYFSPDFGTCGYGNPLFLKWYRKTYAHNTLVVDGKDQKATEGKINYAKKEGGIFVIKVMCNNAYPGIEMVREIRIYKNKIIDKFTAKSKTEHTFDLFFHSRGNLKETTKLPLKEAETKEMKKWYPVLESIGKTEEKNFQFSIDDTLFTYQVTPSKEETVYLAKAPDNPGDKKINVIIRRQRGKNIFFCSEYLHSDIKIEKKKGE